jgi:hypothetical protein
MDLSFVQSKTTSVLRALLPFVLLLQAACTDEMRWKEQVYLHDGSLLEVDRYATRRSSGFPNARRGPILTEEFRYPKLGVEWSAEGAGEQLVSFDVIDGIPYLVTVLLVDRQEYCIGKQPDDYVANYYRWIGTRQEKITRAQTPIAIMRWNVTGTSHWGYDRSEDPTYLSWQDVMRHTLQSDAPELLPKMFAENGSLRCRTSDVRWSKHCNTTKSLFGTTTTCTYENPDLHQYKRCSTDRSWWGTWKGTSCTGNWR